MSKYKFEERDRYKRIELDHTDGKVFCDDCEYRDVRYNNYVDIADCFHPDIFIEHIIEDTPCFKGYVELERIKCAVQNKNNNCKYFKPIVEEIVEEKKSWWRR